MNKTPRISIIIPAKNEENNIGTCLDSVFTIDYRADEYEVIVVDNGSNDQTTQIADKKGAKVQRLPNVNISTLRNLGVRQAKGEIIVFLDADCTVEKDWLKKAEKYFEDPSIVCFGSAPKIPTEPTWVQSSWFLVRKKREVFTEVTWLESMNMFVNRKVYERVGGFNEKLITCEDVDLSYKLSAHGRIVSDQNIQATHHGEAKNIVGFFRKELWRGKSNYSGLWQHGLRLNEIPSLILPPYYLLMASLLLGGIFCMPWSFAIVVFLLWQIPIAGIVFLKIQTHSEYRYFFQLNFLYNVYYLARGLAVFKH